MAMRTIMRQLAMIKEVFELFDTDGEQQLDEEELALAIYTLGFSQTNHVQVSV
jgi:Ca2+-binding EF-hand superfamily protein